MVQAVDEATYLTPEHTSADPASDAPRMSRTWASVAIVAVNLLVFACLLALDIVSPRSAHTVHHVMSNSPHLVMEKLWIWQMLTANFVHSGFIHVAINMFLVAWLGPELERLLGSHRFTAFYLVTGTLAYAAYDVYGSLFDVRVMTVGASGCVFGIIVLSTLSFPRRTVRLYGVIRMPLRWIVLLLVVSDVSAFFWPGGIPWINNVVHLGGAACGAGGWYLFGRSVNLHE